MPPRGHLLRISKCALSAASMCRDATASEGSFQTPNRDLLYVSSAPINDLRKVMEIVGLFVGLATNGLAACALAKC